MKVERNPFTGTDETVQTTEPADTDAGASAQEWDLRADDVAKDAGYEGYLESRIPPEVRALPHRPMKRILFEMIALAEVLVGKDETKTVLYPPSGCTSSWPLLRVQDSVAVALRGMSDEQATKLAGRLSKHETFADWSAADVRTFLADVRALARFGAKGDGLYVLPV